MNVAMDPEKNKKRPWTFSHFLQAAVLVSVILLTIRMAYTGDATYFFLLWNLFLAWIPYGLASVLEKLESQKEQSLSMVVPLYAVWLLFFPNAPYILTDFIHLDALVIPAVPMWYDILLIGSFGVTGLAFGLKSLHSVHHSLQMRFGKVTGWALVLLVMLLSGFGVYLGRFPRWNSWDIVANPLHFASDTASRLASPQDHPYLLAVTFSFAAVVLVSYLGYLGLAHVWNRRK